MNTNTVPLTLDLVLIGGGHAHVHVLKMLGMVYRNDLHRHGVRLTVISSVGHTPYSGMLPGHLAGHYTADEIHLDVRQLARFAGARFVQAAATEITYTRTNNGTTAGSGGSGGGFVHVSDGRPPIRYDVLSIDIGSAPGCLPGSSVIPVKPIASFCQQYQAMVAQYVEYVTNRATAAAIAAATTTTTTSDSTATDDHPVVTQEDNVYTVAIVGGGAGGLELALALQHHLQSLEVTKQQKKNGAKHAVSLEIILVTRGPTILPSHNAKVRAIFDRILCERGVRVVCSAEVQGVEDVKDKDTGPPRQRLVLTKASAAAQLDNPHKPNHRDILVHACFWCVTAGAADWLSTATPFSTTPHGNFLRIQDTYELVDHPSVFAAGDCCHMEAHPRPKAGVFAVRAGPVLVHNLIQRLLYHGSSNGSRGRLTRHTPQSSFLGLISTGDKYAVASKGDWFCLEGAWLWTIKDYIDRKWMAKYSSDLPDLETMMEEMAQKQTHTSWLSPPWSSSSSKPTSSSFLQQKGADVALAFASDPMRCGGCGAKVGSTTVSRVLRAIHQRQRQRAAALGLDPPAPIDHDDAAITLLPATRRNSGKGTTTTTTTTDNNNNHSHGGAIVQTIDYFREIINDPFVFGKIVAVHSLSDLHAMGTGAQSALTLAVAPFCADEALTESTLRHLLAGVSDVLQDESVRLVGGHTCEGLELACGLSVQGYTDDPTRLLRKRGGRVGDVIVLTKPLGTGALFAAEMRARARGDHVQAALDSMTRSSFAAGQIAGAFDGVRSCTDVTGFGLMGHLLEMLMANEGEDGQDSIGATLNIDNILFYEGALEASKNGIYSTLQIQNARNRRAVMNHAQAASAFPVKYPLLFDPQTAGGLMFFVDPLRCDALLALLSAEQVTARAIGRLEAYPWSPPPSGTEDATSHGGAAAAVCTIGSGESATGVRVRVVE